MENEQKVNKVKLVKKSKPEQPISFKESITDIKKQLSKDAIERKKIMNDAFKSLDIYSDKIIDYEESIKEFQLEEIGYKNKIRELNTYLEIYKKKSENMEQELTTCQEEVISLRKKYLSEKNKNSSLLSIVHILIRRFGMDTVSELTGIGHEKLQTYVEEH